MRGALIGAIGWLSLSIPFAFADNSINGWQSFTWGMSVEEALATNSGYDMQFADDATRGRFVGGDQPWTEILVSGRMIEILGAGYNATLKFSGSDGLAEVLLMNQNCQSPEITHGKLRNALAGKYGEPSRDRERAAGSLVSFWILPKTEIELRSVEMISGCWLIYRAAPQVRDVL